MYYHADLKEWPPRTGYSAVDEGACMVQESGDRDKHEIEPKGGRPGPTDQGREGGMATRESAPDLTEPTSDTE